MILVATCIWIFLKKLMLFNPIIIMAALLSQFQNTTVTIFCCSLKCLKHRKKIRKTDNTQENQNTCVQSLPLSNWDFRISSN